MKIWMPIFFLILFTFQSVDARDISQANTKSAKKNEISLDQSRSLQQEIQLDFSRLIISEFKNTRMTSNSQQDFCNYLADEFNLKSYWDSRCGSVVKIGDQENVIGSTVVLRGEWRGDDLTLRLLSQNEKYELGKWTTQIIAPGETLVKPTAEQIAAFLISQIKMIGFVLKVKGDTMLINLGQRKSVRVGQSFKLFEYLNDVNPLNGAEKEIATIRIKKVNDSERAIAEIFGIRSEEAILPGAKLKIDDSSFIKSNLADRVNNKAWIGLGAQLLTIQTSTNALSSVQGRNYNFNYTAFVDLSFGNSKYKGHVLYGSASGSSADVSYLEFEASRQVLELPFNDGAWLVALGLNISQFAASSHVTPAIFEDSQRISPLLNVHLQFEPKLRLIVFAEAQFLFPTFTASQVGGAQIFSYGAEPSIGARFQITAANALEVLGRTRYFALNFSGQTGVRESQTAYLARYIYSFR
jgi:hypothetical protein